MNPSLELRLESVARALETIIIPGLMPTNSTALEQAHLALAHVGLVRAQLATAKSYDALELEIASEMTAALGLGARTDNTRISVIASEIPAETERLNSAIVAHLDKLAVDGGTPLNDAIGVVARFQARRAQMARKWFAPLGFEIDPDALPAIDDELARVWMIIDPPCGLNRS
jgi:hypothetical protein